MKKIKRFAVLLLTLCVLATMLPTVTLAATTASGTCGDNLTWTLDDSGTLTISGIGIMKDFSTTLEKPWNSNRSKIKTVIIEEGVTSVGRYAFYYCENLTSITFPDSIESVSHSVFGGCTSLIQTEGGVSYAGNCVIDCDPSATSVTLREDVVAIAHSAFSNCKNLTSITIPKAVTSIGEQAFSSCTELTTINFASGSRLRTIGESAFSGCSSLESFTIPAKLETIGNGAFSGCSIDHIYITDVGAYLNINGDLPHAQEQLHILDTLGSERSDLYIPDGVTSVCDWAFYNAASITNVYIPDSVMNIGLYAFCNFEKYITVTYCGTKSQWDAVTKSVYWAVKDGFYNENARVDYYHRYNTNGYCLGCGSAEPCGTNVTWKFDSLTGTLTISGTGEMYNYTYSSYFPWYAHKSSIRKVIIENGVTSIGDKAFEDYYYLTSVTIPESVSSIGKNAFYNCTSLTGVVLPAGLTKIGDHAFYGCNKITRINIPATLAYIGSNAFMSTYLSKVEITDLAAWCSISFAGISANPLSWQNNLYLDGELVTALVIPDGVTQISDYAFFKCYGLKSVTIPDSVTSIGYESFYDCNSLESVKLGKGVTSIGYGAFRYAVFTDIVLPDSVTTIGENAFANSNTLTSISLGENIKSIGYYAFYDCDNLTDVYYSGDETERGKISINRLNEPLTDAVWHYNICGGDRTTVHSYEWITDQESTCGADGIKHEECAVCQAKRNENTVMPATGDHSFLADSTCEKCGNKICLSITDSDGNQIGEYTSVSEALRVAAEGQTLALQADVTEADVILPAGVNLDLNGHTLIADSVLTYSSGAIVDTSENVSGLLKITEADGNMISPDNARLPVYDSENGGYRFFEMDVQPCAVTGGNKYWFRIKTEKFAPLYDLICADADVQIKVKMTWDGQTEDAYAAADLAFTKAWANSYNANQDIYITVSVTEAEGVENFKLIPMIASGGVEISGEEM